jgi:hypothetical protein
MNTGAHWIGIEKDFEKIPFLRVACIFKRKVRPVNTHIYIFACRQSLKQRCLLISVLIKVLISSFTKFDFFFHKVRTNLTFK